MEKRGHMGRKRVLFLLTIAAALGIASEQQSTKAAESGFSPYGLGGAAFGAGQTPPPGSYVSVIGARYAADVKGAITIGGELFNLGLNVDFFQAAVNGLYVPNRTLLGGRPAISVTVPTGYIDLEANASVGGLSATRETKGGGLGDINGRLQLGWDHGDFSHLVYVQGIAPTGRYERGFAPDIGLNRPAIDLGWAFTWTEKSSKLQFNGSLGVTFSAENDITDYNSGNDFHFEWAIGREISQGLIIGIVGYDYRQISGDTGAGARLGPFEGTVDAIGAGLSYTTLVDTTPVVFNLRHYQEYNTERRWEGSDTILSGTVRF
jgi:hypothetical protein